MATVEFHSVLILQDRSEIFFLGHRAQVLYLGRYSRGRYAQAPGSSRKPTLLSANVSIQLMSITCALIVAVALMLMMKMTQVQIWP